MDYDDPAQDLHIHLKAGQQTLSGEDAMGLIRWRHNNDYSVQYPQRGPGAGADPAGIPEGGGG